MYEEQYVVVVNNKEIYRFAVENNKADIAAEFEHVIKSNLHLAYEKECTYHLCPIERSMNPWTKFEIRPPINSKTIQITIK